MMMVQQRVRMRPLKIIKLSQLYQPVKVVKKARQRLLKN